MTHRGTVRLYRGPRWQTMTRAITWRASTDGGNRYGKVGVC
jgi:hypothetical protein